MPGPLPRSALIDTPGNRFGVMTEFRTGRAGSGDVAVVDQDVRRGVAEVDAHTQRPGEADLVTQFQRALEFVGARAGDVVLGPTGVEPLTGQPVAVQREHTVEEGVPLLDRQGAVLTVDQAQLVVQPA